MPIIDEDSQHKEENDVEDPEDDDLEHVIRPSGGPIKQVAASAHLCRCGSPVKQKGGKVKAP